MTAIYIILGILAYLAIGGFLSGLFEDSSLDSFYWYLTWPFISLIVLIAFIEIPFERFGYWVLTKIRTAQNRKKK